MNPGGFVLILLGVWAVAQLVKGDVLGRLGLTGGTGSSSTATTAQGFAGVADPAQSSDRTGAILRAALSQQGKPYASLSDPPRTFDCSSFVSWVFKQALGLDLAPLTWTQVTYGSSVPIGPDYVHPGDLIFTKDSEGRPFGHVGIAVDAHTKIHAPRTGDVVRLASIDWGAVEAVRRVA